MEAAEATMLLPPELRHEREERRGKELQLMKVQEWIFVLGEEKIVMSCDLHISQSAHSLLLPLSVCMFDDSSYETVISKGGVWQTLRYSPFYENESYNISVLTQTHAAVSSIIVLI